SSISPATFGFVPSAVATRALASPAARSTLSPPTWHAFSSTERKGGFATGGGASATLGAALAEGAGSVTDDFFSSQPQAKTRATSKWERMGRLYYPPEDVTAEAPELAYPGMPGELVSGKHRL